MSYLLGCPPYGVHLCNKISIFKEIPKIRVSIILGSLTGLHKDRPDAKPLMQLFREACPKDVVVMGCGRMASGEDVRALEALGVDVAVFGQACK